MNFEQHDIENSKSYLLALLEDGNLLIEVDKINEFVNFISTNIPAETLKETLLQTIQSYSLAELRDLEDIFIKEDDFDELISKSFQLEKGSQLKKTLIQIDTEVEEDFFDETITKAFQIEKRKELKQRLQSLELVQETPVIPIWHYLKAFSIAASIIIIFLVWQPQHSSDQKLLADYSTNLDNNSINDFTKSELIKEQNGLRGEEEHFKNYSYDETLQLLEAIALVKQKEFERANEVFNRLHVEKEKNPGLALYLAIADLSSGNLDESIKKLEYLTQLPGFLYKDETKFHLAYAYLKSGKRKKAKELYYNLVSTKSKFSDEAQQTLKKMRWF